jgi:hypothetical protein
MRWWVIVEDGHGEISLSVIETTLPASRVMLVLQTHWIATRDPCNAIACAASPRRLMCDPRKDTNERAGPAITLGDAFRPTLEFSHQQSESQLQSR